MLNFKIYSFSYGFALIGTLLLFIRQLYPFTGENIITSSIMFTMLLASYYHYCEHNNKVNPNKYNLINIAIILGINGSYLVVNCLDLIINILCDLIPNLSFKFNLSFWILLFIYASITVIPIGSYLARANLKLNYYTNYGMLLGAILVPSLLMNLAGIGLSILSITLLWICLSLSIKLNKKYLTTNKILIYILLIFIIYYLNINLAKKFFVTTNKHANYSLQPDPQSNSKIFNINQSLSSKLNHNNNQGFEYLELIKKILYKDLNITQQKILVLGAGGFSFTASGDHANEITYIDLDPKLPMIVNKYFNRNTNYKYHATDAGVFLRSAKQNNLKYKVVFSDVYSTKQIIPNHVLDLNYISNIKAVLEHQGIAIFNIIANPSLRDDYSNNIDLRIRSIFNHCMVIPINYYLNKNSNIVYICNT